MPAKKKAEVSHAVCADCPWEGPFLNEACPLCGSTTFTVFPVVEKTPAPAPAQASPEPGPAPKAKPASRRPSKSKAEVKSNDA